MAKSTYILHNTMKPSTRQAVEHEAWARGTRQPEVKDWTMEPEPGHSTNPEGKTGTQSRTDRAPRLENNQVQRGRDLGMTTDQKNGQRQVMGRKKLELLSKKSNPLYMLQCNAIL